MPSREKVAAHGLPGSPIRGSRYFRGYCMVCDEPMRVGSEGHAASGACSCDSCFSVVLSGTPISLHVGNSRPSTPSSEVGYDGDERI